ncbi:S8 family serine peptidase [Spirosoma soli]|uniref:S8 family serine peptidase n=1 Tax=Spirosoma soli TaxID=1770529 RepID=A0ABW5M6E6_9BACT
MIVPSLVQAQFVPQQPLPNWQAKLTQRYAAWHEQTLRLAQQHGWSLHKNYSNSQVIQLQEVDPLGQPVYYTLHNAEAAEGTRTQALYGGGSLPVALSGNSAIMAGRLGLWDGGRVRTSHQEFTEPVTNRSRIVQKDNAILTNDHATHLAGTLVARGVNSQAKGMAFGTRLSVWDYTDDIIELAAAAPTLLISNHAYGPLVGWVYNPSRPGTNPNLKWEWWGTPSISPIEEYLFGFYTEKAQDLDQIAYNNPYYLMVRSADNKRSQNGPPVGTAYYLRDSNVTSTAVRSRNDTYDVIPAEATAKNVLTVGAADITFNGQNQLTSLSTTSFSGWGPTDDGRIKPDLLGIGTNVFSSVSGSDTAYSAYSGTSMASANVAGSLFLLQELYAQKQLGTTSTPQFMRAATLRGLALHTADRLNPSAGPDYRQGWGLLNTEAAARVLINENFAHLVLERTLTSGSVYTQRIIAQGQEPLVVTLCWTDPAGEATDVTATSLNNRTPKLVNDLDLRLSDGKTSNLPFVLNPAQPNLAATRGDNFRDNVEQIYITNPTPGQAYSLTVSLKGKTTASSQPFSIIVSGLRRTQCQLTASIAPANTTTICAGSTVPLRAVAQSADVTYQWLRNNVAIPNANKDVYVVNQAGSYVLQLTNNTGCKASSQPVNIQLKAPTVTITPTSDQWLCPNKNPIRLTVDGPVDSSVEWLRDSVLITNARAASLTVNQPGRYQVRITQGGCQGVSTATVVRASTVNAIDLLPKETELLLPQKATITIKAPLDPTYDYQWFKDNTIITKANAHNLAVAQPGTYKLRVTQQTCIGWSTERYVKTAIVTGVSTAGADNFTLYPNPVDNVLSVRYAGSAVKEVNVSIINAEGKLLHQPPPLKAINGQFELDFSVNQLPPGHYFLRLNTGQHTQVGRFLKK